MIEHGVGRLGGLLYAMGISSREAARIVGMPQSIMRRVAYEGKTPSLRNAAKIVAALTADRDAVLLPAVADALQVDHLRPGQRLLTLDDLVRDLVVEVLPTGRLVNHVCEKPEDRAGHDFVSGGTEVP